MLRLEGASYRYPGTTIDSLHATSIDLPTGTISGLVGATEAGKSTLCLVLAGLAPRAIGGDLRGSLLIDGEDVAAWPLHRLAEHVVMGLQDPGGQLSMVAETVYEEVAFGPLNLSLSRAEILDRTEAALERLDLVRLAARDPRHLSGGQQQLVVLAGLLAMQPRYLVLDEPLAHLDARSIELVMSALEAFAGTGAAVLIAEQRTDVLASHCRSMAVMASGHIVARGEPAALLSQAPVRALGVPEPAELRLGRLLDEAG